MRGLCVELHQYTRKRWRIQENQPASDITLPSLETQTTPWAGHPRGDRKQVTLGQILGQVTLGQVTLLGARWRPTRYELPPTSSVLSSPMKMVKNFPASPGSSRSSSSDHAPTDPARVGAGFGVAVPCTALPPPGTPLVSPLPPPLTLLAPLADAAAEAASPAPAASAAIDTIGTTSLSSSQSTALPLSQAMSGWSSNTLGWATQTGAQEV